MGVQLADADLPAEIQHELMRFTGLDTNQLLRDPSQQVAYGYVSGNPLAWTDWLGLCETSLWSSFKGAVTDLGHQAVGTLEAAGTMATGTAASLGGGLTFLGTLALTGGDVEAASAVSQGVQQTLTYQPYSQHGNYYLNTLGNASAAAGDFYTENVADNVAEYAGPVAGTIAVLVPNLLPTKRAMAGLPNGNVASRADAVINETLTANNRNITSQHILSADEALEAGQKFLGTNYTEIGKPGSGVFRSDDGARQFRMDNGSLSGSHAPNQPHVHLETYSPDSSKPTVNNHIPFVD